MNQKSLAALAAMLCAFVLVGSACAAGTVPTAAPESSTPASAAPSVEPVVRSATALRVFAQDVAAAQTYTAAVAGQQFQWQGGTPPVYLELQEAALSEHGATLTVLAHNQDPTGILLYGERYTLQFRKKETLPWGDVDCFPYSDRIIYDVLHVIFSGQAADPTDFYITEMPLPPGQYRFQIAAELSPDMDLSPDNQQWLLGVEFQVS